MIALNSRKQLLLAESDLNRAQLAADLVALKADVCSLGNRAKSFRSVASSVAALVTVFAAFRRKKADGAAKPSWWQVILKGASLVSTLWLAFPSQNREREKL